MAFDGVRAAAGAALAKYAIHGIVAHSYADMAVGTYKAINQKRWLTSLLHPRTRLTTNRGCFAPAG
jgi:hypothetical protein